MNRISALTALVSLSTLCALPAYAGTSKDKFQPTTDYVVGGEVVSTCQWPTAVNLGGCTATLVAPNVITYAAHCGSGQRTASFGEGGNAGYGKEVGIQSCETHPQFTGQNFGEGVDFAYCILEEDVTDVPITPILHGCEREAVRAGEEVWIVGFGATQGGQTGVGAGTKRQVKVTINSFSEDVGEVSVGGGGQGACHGDSGGPLYMQLPEDIDPKRGWRVFGATSYGDNDCPGESHYSVLFDKDGVEWIESSSGIDITPCFDGATGDWDPNDKCQADWASDPGAEGRSWDDGCNQPRVGADACGPGAMDETPPTVEIDSPEDGDELESGKEITVKATASDDVEVASVELMIDGKSAGLDEEAPYEWEGVMLDDGEHELVATALDAAGNMAESKKVTVLVGDETTSTSDPGSSTDSDVSTPSGDPSGTDSSDSGNSEDPDGSGSDTGSQTGTGEEGSGDESGTDTNGSGETSEESSDDPGEDKQKQGCTTTSNNAGGLLAGLAFLGAFVGRRRRR